jgi:hypothetical protein
LTLSNHLPAAAITLYQIFSFHGNQASLLLQLEA